MKFERLVELAGDLHCFSPGMVSAGEALKQVRVQLSRWVRNGRLLRICKGWYTLNEPYRRVRIDMNVVASTVKAGSYVSLHAALATHGMIPEYVAETTCVTTGRPGTIDSPFGRIRYRHIKKGLFFGYSRVERGLQHSVVATGEKALLDLVYLTPGSDDPDYIRGLRLQDIDNLDTDALWRMARRFALPRMERAVDIISHVAEEGVAAR